MSRIAVVGAGWAGLSAAVHAVKAGHDVQVFEMAHHAGGRARSDNTAIGRLDNGQHILIGAYRDTLSLMRRIGIDMGEALHRSGLELRFSDGARFCMPAGPPTWAFARAVIAASHWRLRDRGALLGTALRWRINGFRCNPLWTVADLCQHLPDPVLHDLIEPLCVAALNTPMSSACGQTFLRVLHDALLGGPHSADLLLPKLPLGDLLPNPALEWLNARGAAIHLGHRVIQLSPGHGRWCVDNEYFDAVVLAVTAREAARLVDTINVEWSRRAAALDYQPIVTVWLYDAQLHWPRPMMMFRSGEHAPAQFGFSLGALGGPVGRFTMVVSGAQAWISQGLQATAQAALAQARVAFPGAFSTADALRHVSAERRATFACTPGLQRPVARIANRLTAAGDYVDGPYPATLEGAVLSGRLAVESLLS